jgi:putative ABC transport system permease protein
MWRNYLTVSFRALTKNRTYAFINIFGLALGLAACLMILLYVRYETSYDAWLPDADRIYQVQTISTDPETGERREAQAAPRPVAAALAKDFPQIELISKAEGGRVTILSTGEAEAGEMLMVDEPFFRILAIPFLRGDPAAAMQDANSLAISREEAMRRFGTIDSVGRTITIIGDSGQRDLKVTGVFEDLPKNSHLDFTMATKFKEEWECSWSCINGGVYLKLKPGVDAEAINAALPTWEKRNIPTQTVGGSQTNEGANQDWRLVNVADVHLSPAEGERPGNDRRTIATFAVVALLILFMAAVNFTNLATARAGQRAREVALRKVLGARRAQLVAQFIGESVLLTALAMLLALALVELLLPAFSAFLNAEFKMSYLGADGMLIPVLVLLLIVGVAGGAYPAFYLSRYKPATVLKANKSSSDTVTSGRLRHVLVVAQFAISIGLIICTLVVYHQTLFATRSSTGFDREGLIQLEGLRQPEIAAQRDTLVREIERIKGVTSVSGTNIVPAGQQTLYTMVAVPGKADPQKIGWYSVEPDFFATMRIPMLAGRPLSEKFAKDKAYVPGGNYDDEASNAALRRGIAQRGVNIVLNEAGAERLGFSNAPDAVGKQIGLSLDGDEYGVAQATIVGIAANSRFRSLREPIEPTIYYDTGDYRRLMIRYENADPAAVRSAVEQVWKRLAPQVPVEADFTDEKMAKQYEIDARRGQTFAGFTLLAVVIACLGLFGLAAFTAERRTKEIGIRKVFGATVRDIVKLLVWQFSKPVVIANLVAWPVAWWIMRDWLNQFDERIALTPGPFLLAGLLALAIAIGTIAGHAIKVARANPIHALRYE